MMRPNEQLATAGKVYPNAWKMIDQFRHDKGKDLPVWPHWCFLPMSGFYAIVSAVACVERLPLHLIGDVTNLAALGTWRITQGIYRFDDVFQEALVESPITGNLPVDVLYRLPEWCIYIETTGYEFIERNLFGFFAFLEWDVNTRRSELRLLLDTEDGFLPIILHMGNWSIIEALERAAKEASKQFTSSNLPIQFNPKMDLVEQLALGVKPLISLILYICSEKPEYSRGIPSRPQPKRTKKGWRIFPPLKPKIIEVGKSIGDSLRAVFKDENSNSSDRSVRPHIRRGHWHGYWIGKKDGEDRKFIYNWLSPIPVNAKEIG